MPFQNSYREDDLSLKKNILRDIISLSLSSTVEKQKIPILYSIFLEWEAMKPEQETHFKMQVLYTLAKMCYYWKEDDSELIANLLQSIFKCEYNFSLFNALSFKCLEPIFPNWLYNIIYCQHYGEAENDIFNYFLKHSHKKGSTFCGRRFIDVPFPIPFNISPAIASIILVDSKMLLYCLQNGAKLCPMKQGPHWDSSLCIQQLLFYLWFSISYFTEGTVRYGGYNCFQLFREMNNTFWGHCLGFKDEILVEILSSRTKRDILTCAKLVARACPRISQQNLTFRLRKKNLFLDLIAFHYNIDNEHEDVWAYQIKQFLFHLKLEANRPPCLKHICKCFIRQRLYDNWQLPEGIDTLNIPKKLQEYLNLQVD